MLALFWENHSPSSTCSRQYMSAIFYHSPEQQTKAEASLKAEQEKRGSKQQTQTKVLPAKDFYVAEDYHQKYLLQRSPFILEELDIEPGEELTHSHVATRLNSYLGGYGTLEAFEEECQELQLPKQVETYVRSQITKRKTTSKG